MFGDLFGAEDESGAHTLEVVVERGPLREDKTFVDLDEQHVIGEHLRDAYSALGEALAVHRDLDRAGQEYCDEGQVQELDSLTLEALNAVERAWKALCVATDAHEAQLREAEEAELLDDGDTLGQNTAD
jgi:hypothetical protein